MEKYTWYNNMGIQYTTTLQRTASHLHRHRVPKPVKQRAVQLLRLLELEPVTGIKHLRLPMRAYLLHDIL